LKNNAMLLCQIVMHNFLSAPRELHSSVSCCHHVSLYGHTVHYNGNEECCSTRTICRNIRHRRLLWDGLMQKMLLKYFVYIVADCFDTVGWAAGRASGL